MLNMSNVIDFKKKTNHGESKRFEYKSAYVNEFIGCDLEFGIVLERKDAHRVLKESTIPDDLKFLIISDNDKMVNIASLANGMYYIDLKGLDNE